MERTRSSFVQLNIVYPIESITAVRVLKRSFLVHFGSARRLPLVHFSLMLNLSAVFIYCTHYCQNRFERVPICVRNGFGAAFKTGSNWAKRFQCIRSNELHCPALTSNVVSWSVQCQRQEFAWVLKCVTFSVWWKWKEWKVAILYCHSTYPGIVDWRGFNV